MERQALPNRLHGLGIAVLAFENVGLLHVEPGTVRAQGHGLGDQAFGGLKIAEGGRYAGPLGHQICRNARRGVFRRGVSIEKTPCAERPAPQLQVVAVEQGHQGIVGMFAAGAKLEHRT